MMIHKTEGELQDIIRSFEQADPLSLSEAEAEEFALAMEASLKLRDLKWTFVRKFMLESGINIDRMTVLDLCGKLGDDDDEQILEMCYEMKTAAHKIHNIIRNMREQKKKVPGITELKRLLEHVADLDYIELHPSIPGYTIPDVDIHREHEAMNEELEAYVERVREKYNNPHIGSSIVYFRRQPDGRWEVVDERDDNNNRTIDSDSQLKKYLLGTFGRTGLDLIQLRRTVYLGNPVAENLRIDEDLAQTLEFDVSDDDDYGEPDWYGHELMDR